LRPKLKQAMSLSDTNTNMDATEEKILQSVRELFFRFGIKSITMDDVAKYLNMSKKTLYRHFRDKNDMIFKCCHYDMHARECTFSSIASNAADPIDELLQIMNYMQAMFSKVNPNLFYDLQRNYPDAWKLYLEFKEKHLRKTIEENLNKGIEQGLYRSDINVEVLSRLRMEEVEMGFNPELFPPDKFNVKDVQVSLFDHFIHGITALKGHKLINKYKQINEED